MYAIMIIPDAAESSSPTITDSMGVHVHIMVKFLIHTFRDKTAYLYIIYGYCA